MIMSCWGHTGRGAERLPWVGHYLTWACKTTTLMDIEILFLRHNLLNLMLNLTMVC